VDLLWTDFLNSDWHDWRGGGKSEERLDQPAWVNHFLTSRGLRAPVPPHATDLQKLKTFRKELRRMAEDMAAGSMPSSLDIQALNDILADGPVIRFIERVDEHQSLQLLPIRNDWNQVMAEVVASFATTLIEGEGARVRICENSDCRWVFYDDTRNRSKRFCDDKVCGNLIKVRRFRARNKAETQTLEKHGGSEPNH
jgi:predicted RNA-binding Zn ribbon-like protein